MLSPLYSFKISQRVFFGITILALSFLSFPLALGNLSIPNFYVLVLVLVAIIKYHPILERSDYEFLALIGLFLLFNIHLTYYSGLYIEKYKGFIQTMISLSIFVVFLRVGISRKIITETGLLIIILFIFLFSFLEIFVTPVKEFVDFVRNAAFLEHIYANDRRDILLSGHLRPTLFSSEPSHVTKLYFVLMFSYGIVSKKYFWIKVTGLLILGMYTFASPTVILSFLLILFHRYYENIFNFKKLGFLKAVFLAIFAIAISFILIQFVFVGLAGRFERTINGADGSFNVRFLYPLISVLDTLKSKPLFGIGLSAKEYIQQISSLAMFNFDALTTLGNNAFAHSIVYFGGSALLFYNLLVRYISRNVGKPWFYVFIIIFVFSFNMGGLETPRYWVFLALMFLAIEYSNKKG